MPKVVSEREPYRITTLHPRTYNEARTIGEHFREGTPVIMNLTEMDDTDAKRLVDFAAGLVFGLHGSIERVTQKVFLLSPANVDVTAEDKARIAEGGFFNQIRLEHEVVRIQIGQAANRLLLEPEHAHDLATEVHARHLALRVDRGRARVEPLPVERLDERRQPPVSGLDRDELDARVVGAHT